jgi:hypothetical protein
MTELPTVIDLRAHPEVNAGAALAGNRQQLMIWLGTICLAIFGMPLFVLALAGGKTLLGALWLGLGAGAGPGLFGLMWGHLEATAEPPNQWFAQRDSAVVAHDAVASRSPGQHA